MLAYILSVLFALLMLSILIWSLSRDFKYSRLYKKIPRSMGTITEIIGTEKVSFSLRQWRTYTRVRIRFMVQGKLYDEELLLRGKNVYPGEQREVHYFLDKAGAIFVLNDIPTTRLRELGIAALIAIPFSAVLIFLKRQGAL